MPTKLAVLEELATTVVWALSEVDLTVPQRPALTARLELAQRLNAPLDQQDAGGYVSSTTLWS